jgi:hypothetical protein
MPNLDLLDNIIALVVVILLLSLIVQSLQSLFKKLLTMKSKQIEDSLLDLFDSVLREDSATGTAPERGRGKMWKENAHSVLNRLKNVLTIFPSSPTGKVGERADELMKAVRAEMKELGRVNFRGQFEIDSLAKGDLLNIIARVAPKTIVKGFDEKLEKAMLAIEKIESAVKAVEAANLPGEANALFTKLQEALAPLQLHYRSLFTPNKDDSSKMSVRAGLVVADILALRQVLFNDTLDLLRQTQGVITQQKDGASPEKKEVLVNAEKALINVAAAISNTRTALDDAFGGFKTKLTEIENWFDTVMQGFEERYHRGMKSLSMILGAVVVVLLNANVFAIYQSIAVNEALRKSLIDQGDEIAGLQKEIADMEDPESSDVTSSTTTDTTATTATSQSVSDATASATNTDSAVTDSAVTDSAVTTPASDTTATASATDTGTTAAVTDTNSSKGSGPAEGSSDSTGTGEKKAADGETLAQKKKELDGLINRYTSFGFKPLTWKQFGAWVKDVFNCDTNSAGDSWGSRRLNDIRTLLGWIVMTMLLSLGAPFWHDALQSLFGVKNLLQKKNEQRNVEQARGAGNPAN